VLVARQLALVFTELAWEGGPLAVVRYTAVDPSGRPHAVHEEEYQDDPEGMLGFEEDVIDALYEGIDVAVLSRYELEVFPNVCAVLGC
jgi:hypothetical protein